MGGSRASLDRWNAAFEAKGFPGLVDCKENAGRPRKFDLDDEVKAEVRRILLTQTNRTEKSGSIPEAIRKATARGLIPQDLAEEFEERARAGRRIVPEALHRDLQIPEVLVKMHRSPSEALLEYVHAPGDMMWIDDEHPGRRRFIRSGDILEADDATINFPVCVPWEQGGTPCAERYGVMVSRFQWLVAIDRASRFVPGWTFTMRPRSSYRGEDVTSLLYHVFRQHGVWKRAHLEGGVWACDKVCNLLEGLGVARTRRYQPNQKPFIEGLFNLLWTKLSDMPGQVGRFRGEEDATNRVLESCRRGHTDPRQHFPMLGDALAALERVVHERNTQPVRTKQWGTWVPEERWLSQRQSSFDRGLLRPLPENTAWMFAPEARVWRVKGNLVGGKIQIIEGNSIQFDFSAEWLVKFDGASVRCHFDPLGSSADGVAVLAEPFCGHKAGEVLGPLFQVNRSASQARLALGLGVDKNRGHELRAATAAALRRETRTVVAGGKAGLSVTDVRDGLGNQASITRGALPATGIAPAAQEPAPGREAAPAAPVARIRRSTNPFQPATSDAFNRTRERQARLKAAQEAATA